MAQIIRSALVLGLGKVGHLVARLLHETGFEVTGADAGEFGGGPFRTARLDVTDRGALDTAMGSHDCVISYLPYRFNIDVARAAAENRVH